MHSHSVLQMRADWIHLLEAMHANDPDPAWIEAVVAAAQPMFPRAMAVGFYSLSYNPKFTKVTLKLNAPKSLEPMLHYCASFPDLIRRFHFRPTPVMTELEVERTLTAQERAPIDAGRNITPMVDGIALVSHPMPGTISVLHALYDETFRLTPYERRVLTRIALHLDAAHRIRLRPESVKAELTFDGRILSSRPDAPAVRALEEHAARVTEARTNRRRRDPDSLELWSALLDGRVSLAPRGSGRRAHYAVLENAPAEPSLRSLTKSETTVLSIAARGLSTKLVAYALGVSPSSVSQRLADAAAKVGVASRAELVRIAALLAGDPRAALHDRDLTAAEQDVLALLQRGFSNREIAALRSRSIRTIANQVASLLKKTKSSSRRSLLVAGL